MNFWGVEVKSGEVVTVNPGVKTLLHVSQACLEAIKKGNGDYIRVYAELDGKKFLLGLLSSEKIPHINFDVVFEREFKLSHDGRTESVHFAGYKAINTTLDDIENDSDNSDGEPVSIKAIDNGTSVAKVDKSPASKSIAPSKPEAVAGKRNVKIVEPSKNALLSKDSDDSDSSEDDSDSAKPEIVVGKGKNKIGEPSKNSKQSKDSDDSSDSTEDDSDSDEVVEGETKDDSSDDDSEEGESDEETPKKPETSKKRAAESSKKISGPDKKAKFTTPMKTEGKKPAPHPHVATPYPSKQQLGKLAANNDKSKHQGPKAGGSVICNSCSKTFGSDQALQSHSKAKHGDK